jgi:hypothetical protein
LPQRTQANESARLQVRDRLVHRSSFLHEIGCGSDAPAG